MPPVLVLGKTHAENELRKQFTKSERAAIGEAIEKELGKRKPGRIVPQLRHNSLGGVPLT